MIIIETKTGPCFVNEKAIESIEFDQDQERVWVKSINNKAVIRIPTFSGVLQVRYVSDAQAIDYSYNSQEIEKQKHEANENEKELDREIKRWKKYADKRRRMLMKLYELYPDIHDEIQLLIEKEDETGKK